MAADLVTTYRSLVQQLLSHLVVDDRWTIPEPIRKSVEYTLGPTGYEALVVSMLRRGELYEAKVFIIVTAVFILKSPENWKDPDVQKLFAQCNPIANEDGTIYIFSAPVGKIMAPAIFFDMGIDAFPAAV